METKITGLLNQLGGETPAINMWMSLIRTVEITPKPSALSVVSQGIGNDEVMALKQAIEAAQQAQTVPPSSTANATLDASAPTANIRPS